MPRSAKPVRIYIAGNIPSSMMERMLNKLKELTGIKPVANPQQADIILADNPGNFPRIIGSKTTQIVLCRKEDLKIKSNNSPTRHTTWPQFVEEISTNPKSFLAA